MSLQPRARIYGLGTALPRHRASQAEIHRFMSRLAQATLQGARAARALKLLDQVYRGCGILHRHSVLADYGAAGPEAFEFYPNNPELEPFPTTARRMEVYEREGLPLAAAAARKALEAAGARAQEVTHLIFSTCTGFFAPGPDILLIKELGLSPDVKRSVLGFMGCYAGFTGMRQAGEIVASQPEAVVLQVCLELCTLHFQKRPLPDFLIANSLFADGASAAVFAAPGRFSNALALLVACRSRVASGTLDQMSWRIGPTGFEMRLGREVPSSLGTSVRPFVEDLLKDASLSRRQIAGWAIHPGGRRIISEVQQALELDDAQVSSSAAVLSAYGNMSSATLFFVLDAELRRAGRGPLVALGFGPGLTMEGAVLEKL